MEYWTLTTILTGISAGRVRALDSVVSARYAPYQLGPSPPHPSKAATAGACWPTFPPFAVSVRTQLDKTQIRVESYQEFMENSRVYPAEERFREEVG